MGRHRHNSYIVTTRVVKYETKFTDRTLKLSLAAIWTVGTLLSLTYALWLINADLRKCDLIPAAHRLLEVVLGYIPVSVSMFFAYGKILAIWWRQRKRVDAVYANPANGTSGQATAVTTLRSDHK